MNKSQKIEKYLKSFIESVASYFGLSLGLISSIFMFRLIVDTSYRMLYPFIPQFSQGLGISITAFGWLLSVRSASGLLSPLFGVLADRHGRRAVMAGALFCQALGMLGLSLVKGWGSLVPMFLLGIATNAFLPAQQAYISDRVSYERRGRALASVDIAYSVSGMVLLPFVGWIIASYGWRMPLLILSSLSFASALIIWILFAKTELIVQEREAKEISWLKTLSKSSVLNSMSVAILFFISVAIYMSFWGIWLNREFSYGPKDIGLMATVLGVSEFTGALLSGLIVDKVGKWRTSILGLSLSGIVFLLIPNLSINEIWIGISLGLLGLCIEFTIVALFPLYGEQAPEARATLFSLIALGNAIGLAIGVPLMNTLWNYGGIQMITISSFSFCIMAGIVVWKKLHD